MITAEFINNAIDGVVKRFQREGYICPHYYDIGSEDGESWEIHFYIEDEIEKLLQGLGVKFNIHMIKSPIEDGDDKIALMCIWYMVNRSPVIKTVTVEYR